MAKILIVEDSALIRRNLRITLTKAGHEIVGEIKTGDQALMAYKGNNPDLVTMDINMPKLDGISATKKIMDFDKDANIIIISSITQKRMVFEALENGAKNYLIKPIKKEKLISVVNKILGLEENQESISIEKKGEEFVIRINKVIKESELKLIDEIIKKLPKKDKLKLCFSSKYFGTTEKIYLEKFRKKLKNLKDNFIDVRVES